jgi:hypothetical protein
MIKVIHPIAGAVAIIAIASFWLSTTASARLLAGCISANT